MIESPLALFGLHLVRGILVTVLGKRSIGRDAKRLQYNWKVSTHLIAIAFFLGFTKIRIRGCNLTFPLVNQFRWDHKRTVRFTLALAVHVTLPMRPTLMLNAC